jgi:BirA family biotin operon repressor/biotin-[acetyl-CoA-carboxylase] ligase
VTPWRLRQYESLPSTSDLCVTLANAGEPDGLAILAARQTAARGSRGRSWETLSGNLALSVLLRPDCAPADLGQYALLAAVALAEALETFGAPQLALKWPNDVMLDGRKLGGILLESALSGDRLAWLVIGFGANLAAAPDLPTATRLPTPIPAQAVATAVLDRLDHWREKPSPPGRGLGEGSWAAIRSAWLARGPAPGAHLRLARNGAQISGTFAGLSETGSLLLQSAGRVHAFSTGDVLQGA